MKISRSLIISVLSLAFLLSNCAMDPSDKMNLIVSRYNEKQISNSEMLLQLGELYYNNPENVEVLKEYCYRMTISGYGSKVLTDIHTNQIQADENILIPIIKNAMAYDDLYELAPLYAGQQSKYASLFRPYVAVYDSLEKLNTRISENGRAENYMDRGSFFKYLENDEMARYDFSYVEGINPCNADLVFQQSLSFIREEAFSDLEQLLENCGGNSAIDTSAWHLAFEQLADTIMKLESLNLQNEDLLFQKAKIYIENNFPDLALKKIKNLIAQNSKVPDYHALEAFIYYRTNQKSKALASLVMAETLSNNKNTRLRKLIEAMP